MAALMLMPHFFRPNRDLPGRKVSRRLRGKVTVNSDTEHLRVVPALAGTTGTSPQRCSSDGGASKQPVMSDGSLVLREPATLPALAGISENMEDGCASETAAERALVSLHDSHDIKMLGLALSCRWLASALEFSCMPGAKALYSRFSSAARWHEFVLALAVMASKMESDHGEKHVRFRARLSLGIRSAKVFKEASLRLTHGLVAASTFIDDRVGSVPA